MADYATLKQQIATSPAFIVDEAELIATLQAFDDLREHSGCRLLYSLKALPLMPVLSLIKPYVDGFSVSSLFEARLAHEVLMGQGGIHLTSPGIKPDEMPELVDLCSHISCNSFGQYRQLDACVQPAVSLGLRINPQLSYSQDARYDPCRPHSKLGIGINALMKEDFPENIKGLHFHTTFAKTSCQPLVETVALLRCALSTHWAQLDWINLGGGYLFQHMEDRHLFLDVVGSLIKSGLTVFIEPGNAVVGHTGYLLATVIDCFDSDGKTVAVLDTSVNHQPRVFEYQLQPELAEHDNEGRFPAILAGCTCLAGDIFGEYRFIRPIAVGDKVLFKQAGAYSMVKANRFNGYNLPDIYVINGDRVSSVKQYGYFGYRQQWSPEEY
ncbi:MAG: carboxynorspermidine decarboxylase [Gammaproteobacteria bacterium]|nr:carboxynorspermidine decarboxylase [Gammaproteobacteria bacterium]